MDNDNIELIVNRILESNDIEYIYVKLAEVCSYLLNRCIEDSSLDINLLNSSVKVIEEAMKINDVVIIKDILRYEILSYIK